MKFITVLFFMLFAFKAYAHHPAHKIEASEPYPIIELQVNKDSMDGYNIYVDLKNFKLTPELAGQDNVSNQGHMHLYVNDIKISRMYSPWFHIPGRYFNKSQNVIKVTLNANSHDSFTVNEEAIAATIQIVK